MEVVAMLKAKQVLVFGVLACIAGAANAHCMKNKYYMGAGMGINSTQDFSNTAGYQIFAGYCLDFNFKSPRSKTSVEVGYMDSGDFQKDQDIFAGNPFTCYLRWRSPLEYVAFFRKVENCTEKYRGHSLPFAFTCSSFKRYLITNKN